MNAIQCSCGAVTVYGDGWENSMFKATFDEKYPDLELDEGSYGGCNHCINHWGIDICGCGSGEPAGECANKFEACVKGHPYQLEAQPAPFLYGCFQKGEKND